MEKISSCCYVNTNNIQLGTHLEKPFHSCTRMLGTLSFISVRKHHGDPIHPVPFLFTGRNKLVDRYLCTVSKITELRLPDYQGIRICHSISIFKAQHAKFTQEGIKYP